MASRLRTKAAVCASARSRDRRRREYPRKWRPGIKKATAHSDDAATPRACWSAAPAAARIALARERARTPAASSSYQVRRFTRRLRSLVRHAGSMERLAEKRGAQSSEVPTVHHIERRSISSDHAGGDRVEDDARSRGPMSLAGKRHEVLESNPRQKARVRVLLGVRAVYSVDRGRVHDPMGTDESGQGRCDAVRRVSGPRPAHDDDRVSLGKLRGRGVAGGGLAVRPTAPGGRQKPRVQACDSDPELVERPFANPNGPSCLNVVSRNATAARDNEQLHSR